jgi:hypothetical protein
MNDLQFAGRYQCLPVRCSGRVISLQNEHSIDKDAFLTAQITKCQMITNSEWKLF